ncbi:MAG: alanyl-tRNA editing protein [Alphaproteobacteria bacterium]|nr:alanyl-tRNA editing protein [Alphaproteobacteria bacterium]
MTATTKLYEEDSYLRECSAEITDSQPGKIRLNQTILYAESGGQLPDHGAITLPNGDTFNVVDSQKAPGNPSAIWHTLENDQQIIPPQTPVTVTLDWERRYQLMRMHTAMHLLCACVTGSVTGGAVNIGRGRIDFNVPPDSINKEKLHAQLNALITQNIAATPRWVSESELDNNPSLVRTMSVSPPRGAGRIRLLDIADTDLQPCGGTHVKHTGEIGALVVGKIENKGRQNRRVNIRFAE